MHNPDPVQEAPGYRPFWEVKPLAAMSQQEWESLCDGCGQCCLIKVEDEELFPAAARILAPTDLEAIGREMAARRDVPFEPPI